MSKQKTREMKPTRLFLLSSFRLLLLMLMAGVQKGQSQELEMVLDLVVSQFHGELVFTHQESCMGPPLPDDPAAAWIIVNVVEEATGDVYSESFNISDYITLSRSFSAQLETMFEILVVGQSNGELNFSRPGASCKGGPLPDDPGATWTIVKVEAIDNLNEETVSLWDSISIAKLFSPPEAPHPPPQCLLPINNQSVAAESNASYDAFCVAADDGGERCKACVPGFTIDDGNTCRPCQPGFYKKSYGIDACKPCPAGFSTVGFEGQAYCWPCEVGSSTMGNSGQGTCTPCEPHSDTLVEGTPSCICVLGASLDYTGSECVPCPAGTYAKYPYEDNSGPLECHTCAAGMFSSGRGVTSCDGCSPGTYSSIGGLSACFNCPVNTISTSASQTFCEACVNGTYTLREGSSLCMCPAGMQPSQSSSFPNRCLPCDPGFYQPIGEADNNNVSLLCMPCEPGTYNAEKAQAYCTQCPNGKYVEGLASTSCVDCGPHSTTTNFSRQTSAGDCECVPGTSRSFQGADCVLCPIGFYQSGMDKACVGCPAYRTNLEQGSTTCDVCTAGAAATFTLNNQIECGLCEPGSYQPSSQQTLCTACPSGTFSDSIGATLCQVCPQDSFTAIEGSSTCTFCPAHSDTMGMVRSIQCTCDLGSYYSEYGLSCIRCPVGYFQDLRGQSCQGCAKGTYNSISGSSTCMGCASGTFGDVGALSSCANCPINTTSSYSFSYLVLSSSQPFTITACTPCADGTYTLQEGSTFCMCPAGTYPLNSEYYNPSSILLFLHRCQSCSAGFYQPYDESAFLSSLLLSPQLTTPNNTKCEICGPGTFSSNQGQTSCTQCAVGKYESGWGSTNCTECGFFSTTISTAKTSSKDCMCMPGSTKDFFGEQCIACPIGFYQNDSVLGDCLACTGYSTNLAVGSTTCDSCLAGSLLLFQPSINGDSSIAECKPCRPGFYQPIPMQTQCLQCPAGSFSNSAGSTYCSLCAQDSFASVDGSAACLPCPPYSETGGGVSGSTRCACTLGSSISIYDTCIPCPAGSFQAQRGGPCQPCAAGTITPNTGSSGALACIPCPQGTFAGIAGLSACTQCPTLADTQERVGASSCTCISGTGIDYLGIGCVECAPGYYHTTSLEHCTACPGGHFSNQTRSTACLRCQQGMYSPPAGGSTACLQCEGGSITWQNQTSCMCSEALQMFNKTGEGEGWICANCTPSCDYTTSYLVQACSPNQDILCKNCSLECPSGRYMTEKCTATQDMTCKPCSQTCSLGYFMKSKCSETADIICARCTSTCPTKRFAATEACTYTHDLVCSLCPPGTYVKDNNLCVECLDGYAATSLDDGCVPCGEGFYSNPNKTMCVKMCPPNAYPSSSKGCSECPGLSVGNGMGCYYVPPSNTNNNISSHYDNSSIQICKPDSIFEIKEL